MSQAPSLFRNPLFRWGIAAFDAVLLAGVGFFLVEDEIAQFLVFVLAATALILTPQILKRTVEKE